MKKLVQSKGSRELIVVALTVACFGLLPHAHAVIPAADGCYPNYTTAEGCKALNFLTTGAGNTGVGWYSLFSVGNGSFNTGVGAGTLVLNTADSNTAVGVGAMLLNTSGNNNVAVGTNALVYNDSGVSNTAVGASALFSNTDGASNVAVGDHSLEFNVSGFHNIVLGGGGSGFNIVNGSSNVYIGWGVSANGSFDESDAIRIKDSAPQIGGTTSKVFVAGINGATVGGTSAPVIINANGQLGTPASSARFKKDIDPMGKSSEAIFSLKPVTFHYRGDETRIPQFGLIAEEVAKVNPALILVDKEGKPYTVRYEQINAMLLNEFLKEHKTVQELKSTVQKQEALIAQREKSFESKLTEEEKQIEALRSGLEKVSAQFTAASLSRSGPEANKPVLQMASTNP